MVTGTHAQALGLDSAAVWDVLPKAAVTAANAARTITPASAAIQAVVTYYRAGSPGRYLNSAVMAVEADTAACLLASLWGGAPQSVSAAQTVMAGLNCGTLCSLAWPVLSAGLDAGIAVPDRAAVQAMADLARFGVPAGPSGAASLAGARTAITGHRARERRDELSVTSSSVVVLISTEGTAATTGVSPPARGGREREPGDGPAGCWNMAR